MIINYPVKIKVTKKFLEELQSCEEGRHQDAEEARRTETAEGVAQLGYECVFNDFSDRHKTLIECRNNKELSELYYVCGSGTIGLRGYTVQANRIMDQIRDMVNSFNPTIVRAWPKQTGY